MEDKRALQVSVRDLQAVADLLAHPPALPPALIKAARDYAKPLGDEFGTKLLRLTGTLPTETKLAIED